MDFFKSILKGRNISSNQSTYNLNGLESSDLGKLPNELILSIAQFLPAESATMLSLSCRSFHFMLGTKKPEDLERPGPESMSYLSLWRRFIHDAFVTKVPRVLGKQEQSNQGEILKILERDLPHHILCFYCKKLHSIDKTQRTLLSFWAPWLNKTTLSLPCEQSRLVLPFWNPDGPEFTFPILQMTMKLYRQGLDCSGLLDVMTCRESDHSVRGYVEHRRARARFVSGSLLIREQEAYIVPPNQQTIKLRGKSICTHLRFSTPDEIKRFWPTLRPSISRDGHLVYEWHYDYEGWHGLMQCGYCWTEFRFDFTPFGPRGNVFILTKWQDFGEGRSPSDPKWSTHIDDGDDPYPVNVVPGSIRTAFEGVQQTNFIFDDDILTSLEIIGPFKRFQQWFDDFTTP